MKINTNDRVVCHNHDRRPSPSSTTIPHHHHHYQHHQHHHPKAAHFRPFRPLMPPQKHIRLLCISLLVILHRLHLLHTTHAQYHHDAGDTTLASDFAATVPAHNKCEPITIPICKNIPYNMTIMPNLFGHTRQDEAGFEVYHFAPLVKVGCSPDLQFFLCLLYVPLCTILDQPIPPCQSLCKSARNCETSMKTFGYDWPENLECSKFPEDGSGTLCVGQHNADPNATTANKKPLYSTKMIDSDVRRRNNAPTTIGTSSSGSGGGGGGAGSGVSRNFRFVCPLQLKTPADMGYSLNVGETVSNDQSTVTVLLSCSYMPFLYIAYCCFNFVFLLFVFRRLEYMCMFVYGINIDFHNCQPLIIT